MSSNFKYDLSRNLKKYVKFIPQLTKPVLRVLIQGKSYPIYFCLYQMQIIIIPWNYLVSVHYIESARCPPDPLDLALTKLSQTGCEVPENFHELFACIIRIIKLFLRTRKGYVKEEELRECLKELKFTDDCIDDFVKVLLNHRDSLTQNYCEINNLIFSPPKRLQWCINLTLVDR